MKKTLWLFCLLATQMAYGRQTINAMFYNIYRFPDNPPANREFILKDILDIYHPDLFMVCELARESGADRILNQALQTPRFNFARAVFTPTTTDINDPLQQMVFYNMDKLILVSQEALPTAVRAINHYSFILNTADAGKDSVFLDVFVTHLKSSEGSANEQARLRMIDTFVKALAYIPSDHHVLLAGDFNFYSAYTEPAYQKILDPLNPVVMLDPIHAPGNWSDNDSFKTIHTQATRISADGFGLGGATGGLDDRFDFIMMSQNLQDAAELSYVPGTYKAFGNNGNCFNQRIDHYDCDGVYSLELRKNLYNMSDHLPVVMQLQTDRDFLAITTPPAKCLLSLPAGNIAGTQLVVHIDASGFAKRFALCIYNTIGQRIKTAYPPNDGKPYALYTGDMAAGMYYLGLEGEPGAFVKFLKE